MNLQLLFITIIRSDKTNFLREYGQPRIQSIQIKGFQIPIPTELLTLIGRQYYFHRIRRFVN